MDYTKLIDNDYENISHNNFLDVETNTANDIVISSYESLPHCTPETERLHTINQTVEKINDSKQKSFKPKPIAYKKNGFAEKYKTSWRHRNSESAHWIHSFIPEPTDRVITITRFAELYGKILVQFTFDDEIFKDKIGNFMFLNENLQCIMEMGRKYEVNFTCDPLKTPTGNIYFPGARIKLTKTDKTLLKASKIIV
jgi:hypothetical protein